MLWAPLEANRHLLLIGGGHAHVAVVKAFADRPLPRVRLTLVSQDSMTPYSGMVPGLIAGHYRFEDSHIHLPRLCQASNTSFEEATVAGIDLARKEARVLGGQESVSFDLVSVNTGSTPTDEGIAGVQRHAIPLKPISQFLRGWEGLVERVRRDPGAPVRVIVVGGGAGGVELALAAQHRLVSLVAEHDVKPDVIHFTLVSASSVPLPSHNERVQNKLDRILRERHIRCLLGQRVVAVESNSIKCDSGLEAPFDVLFWATNAAAPTWIRESGLRVDAKGFLAVNECFQSLSHAFVFAAGDVASAIHQPCPKSGVLAVRQGHLLALNLRRTLQGEVLTPFKLPMRFLSLIGTGDCRAVGSRGELAFEGKWVWWLKDWIDRRWMRQYTQERESVSE